MLRLTKLTDYGIVLMSVLADHEGVRMTAADLARRTHIPVPTVSKILQILLHEDLLESTRGANGGYRLARPSGDITIREIIDALEGPIALTECNLETRHCDHEAFCTLRSNWRRINEAVRSTLGSISLADMAAPDFRPLLVLQRGRNGHAWRRKDGCA